MYPPSLAGYPPPKKKIKAIKGSTRSNGSVVPPSLPWGETEARGDVAAGGTQPHKVPPAPQSAPSPQGMSLLRVTAA